MPTESQAYANARASAKATGRPCLVVAAPRTDSRSEPYFGSRRTFSRGVEVAKRSAEAHGWVVIDVIQPPEPGPARIMSGQLAARTDTLLPEEVLDRISNVLNIDYEELIKDGLEAFWESVAKGFPNASGDLSPGTTFMLDKAADAAVREWVEGNVLGKDADHYEPVVMQLRRLRPQMDVDYNRGGFVYMQIARNRQFVLIHETEDRWLGGVLNKHDVDLIPDEAFQCETEDTAEGVAIEVDKWLDRMGY